MIKTINIAGQQYQAADRFTTNCNGINNTPAWGLEFLPLNGRSYISNEWRWFGSKQARAAFLAELPAATARLKH